MQQVTLVTHTEFDKTIRNILLIELKVCFDKALQLAVTVTIVSMTMINIQRIKIFTHDYQVKILRK